MHAKKSVNLLATVSFSGEAAPMYQDRLSRPGVFFFFLLLFGLVFTHYIFIDFLLSFLEQTLGCFGLASNPLGVRRGLGDCPIIRRVRHAPLEPLRVLIRQVLFFQK
jgi:hypothetical protein